MRFTIENIGPIKKTEMEFGNLTILCGKNNTGKTYITYNTFNYIDAIKYFLHVPVKKGFVDKLLSEGKIIFSLSEYFNEANRYISESMKPWMEREVHRQMAAPKDFYKDIKMSFALGADRANFFLDRSKFSKDIQMTKGCVLKVEKNEGDPNLTIVLQNSSNVLPEQEVVRLQIEKLVAFMISNIIPDLFIITCERTGAAIFRSNVVASREVYAEQNPDASRFDAIYKKMEFRGHPRPMNKDLEFVVRLNEARQEKSYIVEDYPEIIQYFSEIVGGEYIIQEPNIVKFVPKNSEVGLTTVESSSSIRSLMELNFYLKHKAKKGQALIIDEPELNLHPENQRKIARLLAMLVNADIAVAITTHSDYIVREFDFMTRLFGNVTLAQELGYLDKQLLCADQVKTYVTQLDDATHKYVLQEIPVSKERGIESRSFDNSIEEMNLIQQAIQFGALITNNDYTLIPKNNSSQGE